MYDVYREHFKHFWPFVELHTDGFKEQWDVEQTATQKCTNNPRQNDPNLDMHRFPSCHIASLLLCPQVIVPLLKES